MTQLTRREFLQPSLKIALFLLVIASVTSCATFLSPTPTPKIPRVVFVELDNSGSLYDSFRQGLHDLGYLEGKNIVIDYRSARIENIVRDLVGTSIDVIVAGGQDPAVSAKYQTSTIPIVMASSNDAVEAGLVRSLAHPGGNVTGMTSFSPQMSGKRLELLKQTVVGLARVALLSCMSTSTNSQITETQAAAKALNVDLVVFNYGISGYQLTKENFDAILVQDCLSITRDAASFADRFGKSRLPTMCAAKELVVAGGLMSYGPNISDSYRRAATYVDKILKGTKPADLPVELPTKFDFVINLKTAKELGLTIPQSILAQATEVIE